MKKNLTALPMVALLASTSDALPRIGSPPPTAKGVLVARLRGAAIRGVAPQGKAAFQTWPEGTSLGLAVGNVHLPDGTVLTVALGGDDLFTMSIFGGRSGRVLLPSPSVRAGEPISVSANGDTILSGTFQTS